MTWVSSISSGVFDWFVICVSWFVYSESYIVHRTWLISVNGTFLPTANCQLIFNLWSLIFHLTSFPSPHASPAQEVTGSHAPSSKPLLSAFCFSAFWKYAMGLHPELWQPKLVTITANGLENGDDLASTGSRRRWERHAGMLTTPWLVGTWLKCQ